MKKILFVLFVTSLLFKSCDSNKITEMEVKSLIKTSKSWNGESLPKYPDGKPVITILRITVPPKTKLKEHQHKEINAGVLLKGELRVISEHHDTLYLKAGDPIVELVDTWHYGENIGSIPAEIIVFYCGTEESSVTVHEQNHLH